MWQAGGHPHIATGRHEHNSAWIGRRHSGFTWHAPELQVDSLAGNQRAHRFADHHAGAISPCACAPRGICRRVAARANRSALSRCRGRSRRALLRQKPPTRAEYARMVSRDGSPARRASPARAGRSIIAAASVLLTRVIYTKTQPRQDICVVDAAMNDLMRPALYGAVHPITKVTREHNERQYWPAERADIVGPVCETGDCFLHDWPLGEVAPAICWRFGWPAPMGWRRRRTTTRDAAGEVLVEGNRFKLIRRRETQDDLLRTDVLTPTNRD